jgi:RNA polymerase sigma factor (sigma-70 family)
MKNNTDKKYRFILEWDTFIKTGDMRSLGIVYDNYFDLLYNYGRKFRFENQLIEDAIQNVFVNLIKAQKRLGGIENLASYLFCCFRNELFHLTEKEKNVRLEDSSSHFLVNPENNQEENIIENESNSNLNDILNKSIKRLTASQQEILYMRYDAGLSYENISKIINISVESCRTVVYRAVKSLKKDLEVLKKNGIKLYFPYISLIALVLKFVVF